MPSSLSRRDTLKLAAAAGGVIGMGLTNPPLAASPDAAARLGLDDPLARSRLFAKLRGSTVEATIYTFCRMHLYLWLNDGNLKPMLSMQNLNATQWKPLPDGNFAGIMREVGTYTEFDSDVVADHWKNPVTGEEREVWHFLSGPQPLQMGPDGLSTVSGAALKPREMRIDVIGDTLLAPNYSARAFPNPFRDEKWPKESGEANFYWDSHYLFAASVRELLDPRVTSAASTVQFQNMVSFHPWLGMGSTPGRTYGKALGAKLRTLDDLPRGARLALEQRTPEIFDIPKWTVKHNDFVDYVRNRRQG